MKKAIYLTIGSIVLTGGIVATSVCVPAFINTLGDNPKIFSFNPSSTEDLVFNPLLASSSNVSFKEAVLGTTKINNGTYFLYVGSQAYNTNNQFLYGSDVSLEENILPNPATLKIKGEFGEGLKTFNNLKEKPTVLMVQDIITPEVRQEAYSFKNQVDEWNQIKQEDINKLLAGNSEDVKKGQELQKKKLWASKNPTFDYDPTATYTNWNDETVPYRTDAYAKQFNDMVNFIKSKFSSLKDIKNSDGILIGYKDGNICTNYSGSFSSGSSSDDTTKSNTQSSSFFSTFANTPNKRDDSSSSDGSDNSDNSDDNSSDNENNGSSDEQEQQKNPFITWLEENYGKKSNK